MQTALGSENSARYVAMQGAYLLRDGRIFRDGLLKAHQFRSAVFVFPTTYIDPTVAYSRMEISSRILLTDYIIREDREGAASRHSRVGTAIYSSTAPLR
jgi:hypothetical protein